MIQRLQGLCGDADEGSRRSAGEGEQAGGMSFRVTRCLQPRPGRGGGAGVDELFRIIRIRPCWSPTSPTRRRPDDWLIHAYFEHAPTDCRAAPAARARLGRAADRGAWRSRLGDDEPGRAAADPRRPLLRPHADVPKRPARARSRSRSMRASPSARASMRRPAAASKRSTAWSSRASASRTSPTSDRARACSPSRRSLYGPRRRCIATDIDAVAVDVARDNAAINGVTLGMAAGELLLAVADGMDSPLLVGARAVRPHHRQHSGGTADRACARFRAIAGAGRNGDARRTARHAGRRSDRCLRKARLHR